MKRISKKVSAVILSMVICSFASKENVYASVLSGEFINNVTETETTVIKEEFAPEDSPIYIEGESEGVLGDYIENNNVVVETGENNNSVILVAVVAGMAVLCLRSFEGKKNGGV